MDVFADSQGELPLQGTDDSLLTGAHRLVTPGWLIPGVWEDDGVTTLSGPLDTLEGRLLGSLQQGAMVNPKDHFHPLPHTETSHSTEIRLGVVAHAFTPRT